MSIQDKKILFFAPNFFGYEKDVLNELEAHGAQVWFLPDRPSNRSALKVIYRFAPSLLSSVSDLYYDIEVEKLKQAYFDFVFIQSGEALTIRFLKKLREKYCKAKFIFYTYDSIKNKKGQLEKIKFCDVSYSFDEKDAADYNIIFRPLFFSKGFELKKYKYDYKYHLSFVGTAHSDRFKIISTIRKQVDNKIVFFSFLYLQTRWIFWVKKFLSNDFKNAKLEDFNFISISKKNVQEVFFQSKVILDIEHPNQTGLTMRTFEALGAEKKLITTNKAIKKMDFYNENNILVIDRVDPKITLDFFNSEYLKISESIYNKYTISTWVKEIFEGSH